MSDPASTDSENSVHNPDYTPEGTGTSENETGESIIVDTNDERDYGTPDNEREDGRSKGRKHLLASKINKRKKMAKQVEKIKDDDRDTGTPDSEREESRSKARKGLMYKKIPLVKKNPWKTGNI